MSACAELQVACTGPDGREPAGRPAGRALRFHARAAPPAEPQARPAGDAESGRHLAEPPGPSRRNSRKTARRDDLRAPGSHAGARGRSSRAPRGDGCRRPREPAQERQASEQHAHLGAQRALGGPTEHAAPQRGRPRRGRSPGPRRRRDGTSSTGPAAAEAGALLGRAAPAGRQEAAAAGALGRSWEPQRRGGRTLAAAPQTRRRWQGRPSSAARARW